MLRFWFFYFITLVVSLYSLGAHAKSIREKVLEIASGKPFNAGRVVSESNYVSFKVYRLKHPKLLWINYEALFALGVPVPKTEAEHVELETALLDALGWTSRTDDLEKIDLNVYQLFYADRYGGDGVGEHGGSARSATTGRISEKGIKTPLCTEQDIKENKDGVLSLGEADREILKASFASQLPLGANPVIALIDTGFPNQVLLSRLEPLRPAFYVENQDQDERWKVSEPFVLSSNYSFIKSALANVSVKEGLKSYVTRLGVQYGAAYAKRYYIDNISVSNIGISGKLHDFGLHTTLPAYGMFSFKPDDAPFGDTRDVIKNQIKEFVFALAKQNKNDVRESDFNDLKRLFNEVYKRQVGYELVLMTGAPPVLASQIADSTEVRELGEVLREASEIDQEANDFSKMKELRRTQTSFADILELLGKNSSATSSELEVLIMPHIPNPRYQYFANQIAERFHSFFISLARVSQTLGVLPEHLTQYFNHAATIRNQELSDFYHPEMYQNSVKLAEKYFSSGDAHLISSSLQEQIDQGRVFESSPRSAYDLVLSVRTERTIIHYEVLNLKNGKIEKFESTLSAPGLENRDDLPEWMFKLISCNPLLQHA